jgi:hypothetical protein
MYDGNEPGKILQAFRVLPPGDERRTHPGGNDGQGE